MARDRKIHACETEVPETAGSGAVLPGSVLAPQTMLALADLPLQHREQILALIRAMARDAARADHAAERGGDG